MLCAATMITSGLPAPASAAPATPVAACVPVQATEAAADRMTVICGRPVEILADRTEFSQTFANTDGSRTLEQSVEPQRVRRGGAWVPVDTSLRRTAAGVSPKASVLPMTFSGGGDKLVGRLVNGDREITLTWPTVLPKPQLKGDTAIYPNVLTDVDLQVTASATGFSEVLVVKTRKAAADPGLARLKFGLAGKGVTLGGTTAGGLAARDADGDEVFSVPAPLMWDSSEAIEKQARAAAPAAEDTRDDRTRRTVMPLKLGKGSLTLTPDRAMLTDPRTEFPVYIDPSVSGSMSGGAWTSVWSKYPTKSFWKNTTALTDGSITGQAGVGRTEDCVGCADHLIRSFFRMDTSGVKGDVISAQFSIEQRWAWTCNPKSNAKVWETGAISSATTWKNQPSFSSRTATDVGDHKYGAIHGCYGVGPVEFNVTSMVTDAENTVTIGMKAIDESTKNHWKRYKPSTARMSVTYNQKPNALKDQKTDAKACATGSSRPYVTKTTGVKLTGYQSDPDSAQTLTTHFYWWPTTVAANTTNSVSQSTGNKATVTGTLPALTDGVTYAWRARSYDNVPVKYQMETWSEKTCEFTVDATPPPAPGGLSSTDYSSTVPSGGVGYPGTFRIAAPAQTNLAKDIDVYAWTLDGGVKVSSGTVPVNTTDYTGSITLTPMTDGIKTLRVWSRDRAGNVSGQVTYTFTVLHGSGPAAGWDFDDTAATTTGDTAEHGNTLTLTGGTRVAGRGNEGSALSLNGTSARSATTTGPVTYPNAATGAAVAVRTDANFTVTARVKLTTTTGVTAQQIAVAASGTNTSAYTLGYDGPANKWRFTMAGTDVAAPALYSALSNTAPTAGKWTHLAGTYDAATKKLTLYVNGVAQTTTATLVGGFNATGAVTVGKRRWAAADDGHLNGLLDDVEIFSSIAPTDTLITRSKALQPAVTFPNGTGVPASGNLKVTFDAEGDTNVTRFRYSLDADGLAGAVTAAAAGGTATVDIPVGTTKGDRQLFFAGEDASRIGVKDQRTFTVLAMASLSGPVIDEDGLPLENATVTLQPGGLTATTDANGIYSFPELEVNTYTVRATHNGRCGTAGSQSFLVGKYGLELQLTVYRVGDKAGHLCAERTTTYANGTTVLALTGDDAATRLTLPFAFPFYGSAYLDVCVDTNGLITFGTACASHPYTGNGELGAVAEPNGVIAPFWDDLVVDASANVRTAVTGSGATQAVLIEWNNVHRKGNTAQRLSFSVTLGIDGTITTNYSGLDNAAEQGDFALVGIESPTGEDGLTYSAGDPALTAGKAIVFTDPNGEQLEVHHLTGKLTSATGTAVAGATVTLDPTGLTATTGSDGGYAFYGLVADSYTVTSRQTGRCGAKAEAVVDLAADTVKDLRFAPDYGLMGYSCAIGTSGYTAADTNTWLTGDDVEGTVYLPFSMPFYGRSATYATVSTNGWIGIGGGYLTPLWSDLNIDSQAGVYTRSVGTAPNRSYIIEWRNAQFVGTTDRTTFEAVLHEDGRIAYHYGAMTTDVQKGGTSTVGMVSMSFRATAYWSNGEAALTANSSITYTPAPSGVVAGVLTAAITTEPIAGRTITLNPGGLTTTTGADGSYQFTGVAPGAYYVLASTGDSRCLGQYASAEVYKTGGDAKTDLSLNNDADPYYTCTVTSQQFIAGDTVQTGWTGDDAAWQATAPFPIKLYGETTTKPWISSNGFLTLGPEGATSPDATAIPAEAEDGTPNTALYPFWHDWVVDSSAAIVTKTSGTAPDRQWVVEWRNVSSYGTDEVRTSFEIIFGEDGSATFAYAGIDDNPVERGAEGTVGVEGPGGVAAFQYLYSADLLYDTLGVRYTPKAPETGYLNGTVTCAGEPVDGATVAVAGQSTNTWSDGTYFLGDVPAKTQTVLVTIGSGDCAGTVTRAVLIGEPMQPVDFAVQGAGYLLTETDTGYTALGADSALTSGYQTWTAVTLPFPVTVYGQTGTTLSVGSEGSLDLAGALVMPFRGDWEADGSSSVRAAVRGTAPNRQYVVEWKDVRHHTDTATRVTFQAILDETGGFTFVYPGTDTSYLRSGGVATIGLRAADGSAALIHSDRLTALRPGVALRIDPVPSA
ncbi:carboxypeptidase regulatory-like domain-containing protein [Actinoplanes subglobosus]|uniref:Carboxypeptidase regulatory-like domain-containing protein n=1 Tax=Actinoplanes subglobosus TaxID=1547892 RepID=A0ABV8JBN9_9ACTN